ncbi:hypothetical protein ALQ33_04331 [Pseudomonas syringae pv. philadelphi]|uniref:DUF3757 domain-containing protein n=1 Tax=Pseudomonas syringae pv. philadelphi TaxID=251706 RepID=A0A3M3Y5Y7_9PSED|nr:MULTISPECIES: DUF3757 domain-containing protein [Pseudomonas syringae group]RMO77768.1 hypothetical protein ALQ33_04331 [Pseudomonas syringae pv. philadelphi]SDX07910.1 Protein of unknown function [Pseudomonas syringae]SFM25530.1 Protein of unknown function [Pseudomonas syringae]
MKKILISIAVTASLTGMSMASQAMENCPAIAKIEKVSPGVYRAGGTDGEWTGIVQGAVANDMPVQSFDMALATQENPVGPQRMQYCTYNLDGRKTVDMRFIANVGKHIIVKTEGNAWKKEEGPLGLTYNVCEETSPENCKFTIITQ